MTAAAEVTVQLPAALPHQVPVLEHAARFKVLRWGRRTGKSRTALIAAIDGHGPARRWPGAWDGAQGVWISPDYPQSRAIWREEIKPRFSGVPGVSVHETDRRLELPNGGSVEFRSAEAIDSVRGRRLDFAIVDEAAHLDLEYCWDAVLRPALADRSGWALILSTPNAGPDGNTAKRTPSEFNRWCHDVESGQRGPDWLHSHLPTDANPKLPRAEVAALRASYPADSPTLAQEVDAELVAGGLYALSLEDDRHVIPAGAIPEHWRWFGGYDWGYAHPGYFGLFSTNESGRVVLVDSVRHRQMLPASIAAVVDGLLARYALTWDRLDYVAGGLDLWDDVGARGQVGPRLADVFAGRGWPLSRATTARVRGLNNLRAYLAGPAPRLQIMDTPTNRTVIACLRSRITDPLNPEDVIKQDADANGEGGDDAYDMVRYALMGRPVAADAAPVVRLPGQHPGFETSGKVWRRVRDDADGWRGEPEPYRVRLRSVEE